MKKMKKLASLILAIVMVLSMTMLAFADNVSNVNTGDNPNATPHTIKITNSNSKHTYEAYQIFSGDFYQDGEQKKLSNVTWGKNVDGAGLLAKLNNADNEFYEDFKDCKNAADVADVLSADKFKEAATLDKFAKIVDDYLNATSYVSEAAVKKTVGEGEDAKTVYEYTINVTGDGYYLVKDKDGSVTGNDSYTRYIMQVVDNVEVNAKSETPTIEKKIVEGDTTVDANTAGVGQVVSYQVKGNVPNRTGYKKYFYVISDKLSDGLTLNTKDGKITGEPDITVKVVGEELTKGTDYYVYTDDVDYTFQIAFANILDSKFNDGDEILVTYSATVNDKAVVGNAGNPNKVTLTYSNNPNSEFDGDKDPGHPGIPDKNVPTGETPEDITITYVAEIKINKTANDETTPLPGAEFTLTGTSYQTVLTNKSYYTLPGEGETAEYWLLKNGTYTTDEPQAEVKDENGNVTTESTGHLYVSTTVKYVKKKVTTTEKVATQVKMVAVSNKNGEILFKGLGAGTYTIEETGVPQGYNKADNMTVVIECTVPTDVSVENTQATWRKGANTSDGVTLNGVAESGTTSETGSYEMTIINVSGALLPSTGGIGTTIFYAVGIILMAGAVFFVVRKRRA